MHNNSETEPRRLKHNDLKFQKPLKEMYTYHLQFQKPEGDEATGPEKAFEGEENC